MKCGYNSCKWCGFAKDCEIIKENKDLQKRLDTLQGFLDRDVEYDELKNNLKKAIVRRETIEAYLLAIMSLAEKVNTAETSAIKLLCMEIDRVIEND